jgi:ubiquinone/menaquinone biosynthesis C-methylase UbiE
MLRRLTQVFRPNAPRSHRFSTAQEEPKPGRLLTDGNDRFHAYIEAAKLYPQRIPPADRDWLYTKPYDWRSPDHIEFFFNMHNAVGLLRRLRLNSGADVLEVGCGSGWLTEIMIMLGYQVTACDPSPGLLEIARHRVDLAAEHHRCPSVKERVRFVAGTLEELNFAEGAFDCVILYDVLHHIVDEKKGIANCARWLRPGGALGVVEGALVPGDAAQEAALREEMAAHGTLENPFAKDYLDQILRSAGLTEIERLIGVSGFFPVACQNETLAQHAFLDPAARNDLIARKPDGFLYSDDRSRTTKVYLTVSNVRGESKSLTCSVDVENIGETVLIGGIHRPGTIYLALRKGDPHSDMQEAANRVRLQRNLRPGERLSMNAKFVRSGVDGAGWVLDAVAEDVAWLSKTGSEPVPVEIAN